MTKIMLCGANDLRDYILPDFIETAMQYGFQPLNYLDGTIYYHNYSSSPWEENSKLSVNQADIIAFVINEKFGQITWNIEFEEAYNNGKNFIFLCYAKVYNLYLSYKSGDITPDPQQSDLNQIFELITKLESELQITIINFDLKYFKETLNRELNKLINLGITLLEGENKKNSFLPLILSSKFNDNPDIYINNNNNQIARDILFDFFESKQIRKRVLEYFYHSQCLSDTEIIEICLDSELGVSRKAIENIGLLVHSKSILEPIFDEVLYSISNEEIGTRRRAINSFTNLNLRLAVKYLIHFFPTSTAGISRRIVSILYSKKDSIISLAVEEQEFKNDLLVLLKAAKGYDKDIIPWRDQVEKLEHSIRSAPNP